MEKTDWYSGDVKPVHVGAYERKYGFDDSEGSLDFYDGREWSLVFEVGHEWFLVLDGGHAAPSQDRPWRGLTKEAK